MSTHAFSSLSENPTPLTTEATEEHREQQTSTDTSVCATRSESKSLLDEPWKVTLIPAGAPVGEDPNAAKSLPWRVGDVTRLKDDSPRGMMEYIATHSTGWWREMAERALRDTEKAERMAREQGWQPGQYWVLEVDAEAKQKLLEAEEAKRAREEAARTREVAEKEAFVQRQMELLERAGRAPRCEYKYTDGRGCRAPQVKGERWCHGHAKMMSYRPEQLEILPMEDEQAVMVNFYRVTRSLLAGRITEKVAGLTLWSIAIGMPGARNLSPQRARRTQRNGRGNTHHGDTETRRKIKNNSPKIHGKPGQVNTNARRSERKVGRESRHTGTRSRKRGCASRNLDGSAPRNTGASLTMTSRSAAKSARRDVGHAGVTNDKSFVSGVDTGVGNHKTRQHRENSLNRHGHNSHSRGPSTPPRSHCSLGVGRDDSGKGCRETWSDVDAAGQKHCSVSPCLSGEIDATGGGNSSVSPCLSGEIESVGEIKRARGGEIASFCGGD